MKSFLGFKRLYEATTDQIAKEFEGKVPDDLVADVMDADPTADLAYARPLLNLYRRAPYDTTAKELGDLLTVFQSLKNKKKLTNPDLGSYKSFDELRDVAKQNQQELELAHGAQAKRHAPANPIVYRGDDWIVQELLTHQGSRFFCPSETHGWCTGYKNDYHWKHYDPGVKGRLFVFSKADAPDDIAAKRQMYVPNNPSTPVEFRRPNNAKQSVSEFVTQYPGVTEWLKKTTGRSFESTGHNGVDFPPEGLVFDDLPEDVRAIVVENNRDIAVDGFGEQIRESESHWNENILPSWMSIEQITDYGYYNASETKFEFNIDDQYAAALHALKMPETVSNVPGLGDVPLKLFFDKGVVTVSPERDGTIRWDMNNRIDKSVGQYLFNAMNKPYGTHTVKMGGHDFDELTDEQKELNLKIERRLEEWLNHYPNNDELYDDLRLEIGREIVNMYDHAVSDENVSMYMEQSDDRYDAEGNRVD